MSGPGRGPYPTPAHAFAEQLDQARLGTTVDEVARSWPRWPTNEQRLRARWLSSCSATAVAATHQGFEQEDFFDVWPDVPTPVALVYGAESPVVTEASAIEARRSNPAASVICVPDAGHMVFWDNPDGAREQLRRCISRLV